jgi:hypothetical protein
VGVQAFGANLANQGFDKGVAVGLLGREKSSVAFRR